TALRGKLERGMRFGKRRKDSPRRAAPAPPERRLRDLRLALGAYGPGLPSSDMDENRAAGARARGKIFDAGKAAAACLAGPTFEARRNDKPACAAWSRSAFRGIADRRQSIASTRSERRTGFHFAWKRSRP
ncbi:MAG: hypothetical protein ABJ354_06940, partial [Nitratireductor sp.]